MSNIFERGTREKVRFQLPQGFTPSGLLTTEELWSIKKDSLVAYEESLQDELEKYGKPGRRRTTTKTAEQELVELKLAIVTHILDVKESEQTDAQLEAKKAKHNAEIFELIARKEMDEKANLPIEELRKLIIE